MHQQQQRPNGQGVPDLLSKLHRNKGSGEESSVELTPEEYLLGTLLEAHETLTSVLRVHDDLERIGIEREAMERSRQKNRLDRAVGFVPCCAVTDLSVFLQKNVVQYQ